MTTPHIRDFHPDDLDGILHLWEQSRASGAEPVYALSEVVASCQIDHAVVATLGDRIVGAAVGRAAHAQGWIVFFATDPAVATDRDAAVGPTIGARMLAALERHMAPLGLSRLSALMPESEASLDDFAAQGFELKRNLRYVERELPVQREELVVLRELGGRILARGLWDGVGGMQREKEMLELRLVTPLAQPDLAERFGVVPPRAVMLFGPPGTGKTTFAKAIASRLEWSFVEVFPSRLAGDPKGLAGALRETFQKISELEHAVVFIDEVEEIASHRQGEPPSPTQGVTNELLKLIPEFREQSGRLLICATNFIRSLDTAFLRHGRFDYVVPIGLPDTGARRSIWSSYLPRDVAAAVDVDLLVEHTAGFTPADIEFAARKASQAALERALHPDVGAAVSAENQGPLTDDYLVAVTSTRRTVSDEVAAEFLEDIDRIARL
ncbi:MAG: ATP-binding protein [Herbiconiux sp.]|uniref:ATP-binding protein n=1 Tax=Herbiconiux sp. TaxID=1871186 RepID=UPI00120058C4|nr:ATP-binding protein [Herbiconiux sp.]TAJ49425.1 MAG: ATP-binding protein [Herbiconiux sp.]